MLSEVIRLYLETVTAFWQSLARGGFWKLLLIGLAIWWFLCRRGRCWGSCSICGCRCGCCTCDDEDGSGDSNEIDIDVEIETETEAEEDADA